MKMNADEARRHLNLPPTDQGVVETQQVRAAFRRAVKAAHPDAGADPVQASALIERLGEARQVLLDAVDNECQQCQGVGYVATRGRFQMSRLCLHCDGSGEQP